ncbi:Rad1-domain-containing protein [Neocallimastix lanati (nom. inval.)]|uniref:Rad1-domain-containing protein n=1 Tax=Neocallimastix californiae TaxID=1754190 RepID=A0A1Y2ERJ9_9FUNG|nr:Rad1-domain-containing protein [Neocallimastix sp. JGI-2020a]ORY74210.1 Rad1-domain-containing protein [Neocallimastix californiae]|eukprot:ORY74210.1 Rad1-domain-containing protein [Neocallimastix californiae]
MDYSFKATLNNIKPLIISLKAIASSQNYNTNCLISDYGIKFSIQNSSSVEARAYIQKSYFQEYSLQINQTKENNEMIKETQENSNNNDNEIIGDTNEFSNHGLNSSNKNSEIIFSLNINTLLDCLTIFGGFQLSNSNNLKITKSSNSDINVIDISKSKTTLRMECNSSTGRLDLLLEDNGVITVCKLNTYEFNETSEIEAMLNQYPLINQLILNSKWLNDAFSTLDSSCEEITIRISQEAPYFEISATNVSGTTKIEYTKNPEVIETFNCNATSIFSYKYSLLTNMFKALALSTKTQLKTNSKGVLQFQFMIPTIDTMVCFVDYIIIPSIE